MEGRPGTPGQDLCVSEQGLVSQCVAAGELLTSWTVLLKWSLTFSIGVWQVMLLLIYIVLIVILLRRNVV